jgi:hypothetical protein
MPISQFEAHISTIQSLSPAELNGDQSVFEKLRIAQDSKVQVCYAPFDYVNPAAKLVIVGITPGRTQMLNAIREARRLLDSGATPMQSLMGAKRVGAFSGAMRPNLVAMLNRVGVSRWLNLSSADELFGSASRLVQTTSVLQNPVFLSDGSNYNGSPSMTRTNVLRDQLVSGFARSAAQLSSAYYLPLGTKVAEAIRFLVDGGLIDGARVLYGMPHPSPASMERVNYFLGKKPFDSLSIKTNGVALDEARNLLSRQIASMTIAGH